MCPAGIGRFESPSGIHQRETSDLLPNLMAACSRCKQISRETGAQATDASNVATCRIVFGPVWTVLYGLLGVASYQVLKELVHLSLLSQLFGASNSTTSVPAAPFV